MTDDTMFFGWNILPRGKIIVSVFASATTSLRFFCASKHITDVRRNGGNATKKTVFRRVFCR